MVDQSSDQFAAYISEPEIPRGENPLSWWSANRRRWPLVAAAAAHVLGIPATAIPGERLLTKKGDEVMDRRCAVTPGKTEQVLFVMENL